MPATTVICPGCGTKLGLPDTTSAQAKFRCPRCTKVLSLATPPPLPPAAPPPTEQMLADMRERFQKQETVRVEDYLLRHPDLRDNRDIILDLIYTELLLREQKGEKPGLAEYQQRFPMLAEDLRVQFEVDGILQGGPADDSDYDRTERPGPTADRRPAGMVVPGYETLEMLGRGGMGIVYKARQHGLNRLVALKTLRSGAYASDEDLARFRTEAEVVARLQHPNFVQIFEVGSADGCLFLALEFVEGGTLAQSLNGTPWPAPQAARLVETLAAAIDHAHEHGVVHRDLKPANILLKHARKTSPEGSTRQAADSTRNDATQRSTAIFVPGEETPDGKRASNDVVPKITDFGLAKDFACEQGQTETGAFMGTPSYAAPEQALGNSRNVTPRTDVYALGAILYELVTGRPPFRGTNPLETLDQVRNQEPVSPRLLNPALPRDLETICLKCLQKLPSNRYGSAAELAADLGRFLRNEPIRARPVGTLESTWRWCQRNQRVASLLAALAVSLLLGMATSLAFALRSEHHASIAKGKAELAENNEKLAKKNADIAKAKEELADKNARLAQKSADEEKKARVFAEEETKRADRERDEARESLFTSQMLRVSSLWEREPVRARELLDDVKTCPPERHDLVWRLFNRACSHEIYASKPSRRPSARRMVGFSADGQTLFIADGPLRRIDLRTGHLSRLGDGHDANCLVLTPDGKTLITGSNDKAIQLWDAATGNLLGSLNSPAANTLACSADGGTLASGGSDGSISLWNLRQRRALKSFAAHKQAVTGLAFHPAGKFLVSTDTGSFRVHDLDTGAGRDLDTVLYSSPHFTPDGKLLYGGNGVFLRDLAEGSGSQRIFAESAHRLEVSTGGRFAVMSNEGAFVQVLDLLNRRVEITFHDRQYLLHMAISHDGNRVASIDKEGAVKVWDLQRGGCRTPMASTDILAAAVADDGRTYATLEFEGPVGVFLKIWDRLHGLRQKRRFGVAHNDICLRFTADGKSLLAGKVPKQSGTDIIDVASAQVTGALPEQAIVSPRLQDYSRPPSKRLAAIRAYEDLVIVDTSTWKEVSRFKPQLSSYALSPDGQMVASPDDGIGLWDATTGKSLGTLSPPEADTGVTIAIAFSPDGKLLAFSNNQHDVQVYDPAKRELVFRFRTPQKTTSLAFSKDSRTLILGDGAGVRFWDVSSRQERGEILGKLMGFSPDGDSIILLDTEGQIRLWTPHPDPRSTSETSAPRNKEKPPPKSEDTPSPGKLVVQLQGQLLANDLIDPVQKRPCKQHKVMLLAKQSYVIDMKSRAFDCYLRLENPAGTQVAFDDDSGGGLDARIRYTPAETGSYTIIATSFNAGVGPYTLKVQEGGCDSVLQGPALALSLVAMKNWDEALAAFDKMEVAELTIPITRQQVHFAYWRAAGRANLVDFYVRLNKRLDPGARLHRDSARLAAEVGAWQQAAADYAQIDAKDVDLLFEQACVHLLTNDAAGHAKICAIMRAGKSPLMRPFAVSRAYTLTANQAQERAEAAKFAADELRTMKDRHAALTVLGALDVRAGRFDEAQKHLQQCLDTFPKWEGLVLPRLWLALALRGQGKEDEARKQLELVRTQMDRWGPHMPVSNVSGALHLHDWLEAHVVRREVERTLSEK